jgi:hypothetical protein
VSSVFRIVCGLVLPLMMGFWVRYAANAYNDKRYFAFGTYIAMAIHVALLIAKLVWTQ